MYMPLIMSQCDMFPFANLRKYWFTFLTIILCTNHYKLCIACYVVSERHTRCAQLSKYSINNDIIMLNSPPWFEFPFPKN